MIRRVWLAAAMILIASGFAVAASQKSVVDGRWQGTLNTANGEATMTFDFKTEGHVLTGTESTPIGSHSISEGKVNGDKDFVQNECQRQFDRARGDGQQRHDSTEKFRTLWRI